MGWLGSPRGGTPKLSVGILSNELRAGFAQEADFPETVDQAAPQLGIGLRADHLHGDPFRLLHDPVRNLNATPEELSLARHPFDCRAVGAVKLLVRNP